MRVLLVDDEPLELENLEKMVNDLGKYEVVKAENGIEAVKHLQSGKIDLVFLDIKMPGMNGLEVLSEIHNKWPEKIVSMVSAFDDFHYAKQAIELGAIGYLLKPFSDDEFNKLFIKMKETFEENTELNAFVIQSIIERSLFSKSGFSKKHELKNLPFIPEVVFVIKGEVGRLADQIITFNESFQILVAPKPIDEFTLIVTTKGRVQFVKEQVLLFNLSRDNQVLYGIGEDRSLKIAYAQALNDYHARNRSTFTQFMHYLKENYYKNLSLSDVAKEVHVSSSHLNRLLKKEYGKTFTEILMDIRIEKAKGLLLKSYNVEVVSDMVGFNSAAYFAVCFKKFTGVSPSRYRSEVG
jgi:two-component system, response regulator YesN